MASPGRKTDFKEPGNKSSVIIAAFLFLVVMAIAFYAWLLSEGMNLSTFSLKQLVSGISSDIEQQKTNQELFSFEYDSKEQPLFGIYRDYIVRSGRDGIWLLDKKGRGIWSESTPFTEPVIRTCSSAMLVADIGGRDIVVIGDKAIRWKDKTDALIIDAEIDRNGYVTVITESKRNNGEVRVYDGYGIEVFRSIIANDFALKAKVAPSGRQIVINTLNASGVKAYTWLKFLDMSGQELAGKGIDQEKGIHPVLWYSNDDSLYTVGDASIACFDKNRELKWTKDFTRIYSSCIIGGKRLAVAVQGQKGPELKIISPTGQEVSSSPIANEIKNISSIDNIIAVNCGREVDFLTDKGKSLGKYNSRSDILNVHFFSRQQAVVVTLGYVAVIDIK